MLAICYNKNIVNNINADLSATNLTEFVKNILSNSCHCRRHKAPLRVGWCISTFSSLPRLCIKYCRFDSCSAHSQKRHKNPGSVRPLRFCGLILSLLLSSLNTKTYVPHLELAGAYQQFSSLPRSCIYFRVRFPFGS